MFKNILVPVVSGIEELEAVTIIDTLRRAGQAVRVTSLEEREVNGANGIKILADSLYIDEVIEDYDAIILPGGTEGARLFAAHGPLVKALKTFAKDGKLVAAICASPALVLAPNGILDDKKATCYPSFKDKLKNYVDQKVVEDDNIVTSQGPGTALHFALALAKRLAGQKVADEVKNGMLASV